MAKIVTSCLVCLDSFMMEFATWTDDADSKPMTKLEVIHLGSNRHELKIILIPLDDAIPDEPKADSLPDLRKQQPKK